MATNEESTPTPDQAREQLRIADAEEFATVNRPVPLWYYPTLALLVLALFLLNSIEWVQFPITVIVGVLTVCVALVVAVLVARVSFSQPAYRGVKVSWTGAVVGGLVAAALVVAPIVLQDTVGSWIWVACGLTLSGLILIFGIAYWRRTSRA